MAEGVVAEFKAVVEPHLQGLDALIDFSRLVELLLVDEADHGNFLVAERGQQFRGHGRDVGCGQAIRHPGGKIVNGDRDPAVGLRGFGSTEHGESRQQAMAVTNGDKAFIDGS